MAWPVVGPRAIGPSLTRYLDPDIGDRGDPQASAELSLYIPVLSILGQTLIFIVSYMQSYTQSYTQSYMLRQ